MGTKAKYAKVGDEQKIMWMESYPGHRIFCDKHKPMASYQIDVSLKANCWACLRGILA